MTFSNAQSAFEYYYDYIIKEGIDFAGTKALFNIGFTILNPKDNIINTKWRNFSSKYAQREWQWYLEGDPNAEEISNYAPIWKSMMDEKGNVRSNYGWQWNRNNQIIKVIDKLKSDNNTRQATISIYDGKEIDTYSKDTPCTYAIQFSIYNNKLHMSILMRSNDLWYGFCNDQYCFSNLHNLVATQLKLPLGTYYHFAHNLHLYNNFLNKKT